MMATGIFGKGLDKNSLKAYFEQYGQVAATPNPHPSTLSPQPSSLRPQPSALSPQPFALSPLLSALNTQHLTNSKP